MRRWRSGNGRTRLLSRRQIAERLRIERDRQDFENITRHVQIGMADILAMRPEPDATETKHVVTDAVMRGSGNQPKDRPLPALGQMTNAEFAYFMESEYGVADNRGFFT